MIKYLSTLSIILISFNGVSQTEIHELHFAELIIADSTQNSSNYVEMFVFDHINSNSISNSFVNDFLYEGHISEGAKQASYDLEQDKNRMGAYFDYGIMFKHKMKNDFIYTIRYRDINYRTMGYDSNLLRLALSGNKMFENQKIELEDFNFKERSLQEISLGLEKYVESKKLFIGGAISFLKADYSRSLDIKNASFYTAPDGQYVDFAADISLRETGKSGAKIGRFEGMGTSINLYALKELGKDHILQFAITDLGFISTLRTTSLYEKDTSISIQGSDLLNSSESGTNIANGIGLEEVFEIGEQQEKYNYFLPFFIRLNYTYFLDDKWTILAGLYYRNDENYVPKLFIKPGFNFNKQRSRVAPLLSYGGFSEFDLGISFYQKITGDFYFTADILYLEALLAPNTTSSQGFNLGVYSKF